MAASLGKTRSFETGSLTISIAGPIRVALDISLSEQRGKGHFAVDVALVEVPALPEVGREPPQPVPDAKEDIYGENGEKTPYHPARRRQLQHGEFACAPLGREGALGPVCRAGGHETQ